MPSFIYPHRVSQVKSPSPQSLSTLKRKLVHLHSGLGENSVIINLLSPKVANSCMCTLTYYTCQSWEETMATAEAGALLHSSILPLSQIHRKGRYIHLLRTGRKHECLENRVVCPLLEETKYKSDSFYVFAT